MAEYLPEEVYAEVSKIFRTRLEPGREGGTLNTKIEYLQLLETAATTFLFNDNAVYHLARLSANSLTAVARREVALLEDILVSLEDLAQLGKDVVEPTTLSNASTTLLSLDAATSVKNRPETARFIGLMDKYAGKHRDNVVSRSTGSLVRTREEARNITRENLDRLVKIHARLVPNIEGLRDLLVVYDSLDIPSRVSTTALLNIRSNLETLKDNESLWTSAENRAASRMSALTAMSSKVAVKLLSEFGNPQDLKYRSPTRPIPSTLKHYIQVTGEGEPAYGLTGSGPWQFPLSAPLTVVVDGGSAAAVDLDQYAGSVINGRSPESFTLTTDQQRLIAVLDPSLFEESISSSTVSSATLSNHLNFSFKHLGAPVSFLDTADTVDQYPRAITELRHLQTCTMSYNSSTKTATCSSFTNVDDLTDEFYDRHLGCYLKDSAGERFEIVEIVSTVTVVLSVPDVNPAVTPTNGSVTLHGEVSGISGTKFEFGPATTVAPTGSCSIGPTTKVADLGTGTLTAAAIVAKVQEEDGLTAGHVGAALNKHVKVQLVANDPTRLALAIRNRRDPYLLVGTEFLDLDPLGAAGDMNIVRGSAHEVLGFDRGALLESLFDSNDQLSPEELGRAIAGAVSGVAAEEVRATLATGDSLNTTQGTKLLQDLDATFQSSGVVVGDVVILSGPYGGYYKVAAVNSETELEVSRASNFPSSGTGLDYSVLRWRLQVSSQYAGPGSSIAFSGPSELGFPSTTQYGTIKTVEAVDSLGKKLQFDLATPGDLLRIVGSKDEYDVVGVDGTTLTLSEGLPSNTERAGFELRRGGARAFESLNARLSTFTSSSNLLKKNGYDTSLDYLVDLVTAATLPGQNFASNRSRAQRAVAELLAILTDTPLRSSEYTWPVDDAPDNLLDILDAYSASPDPALTAIINTFSERQYLRAVDLLLGGKLQDFFSTTEETGSYGGALMQSSRTVLGDLPRTPTSQHSLERQINSASRVVRGTNAEEDFSDTEGDQELGL